MAKKVTDTSRGSPIARSNRFFLQLKAYGMCDENGRTLLGIGMSQKKIIAEPDAPMALMVALIQSTLRAMDYSSPEAAAKDVERLQKFANSLLVKPPTDPAIQE